MIKDNYIEKWIEYLGFFDKLGLFLSTAEYDCLRKHLNGLKEIVIIASNNREKAEARK